MLWVDAKWRKAHTQLNCFYGVCVWGGEFKNEIKQKQQKNVQFSLKLTLQNPCGLKKRVLEQARYETELPINMSAFWGGAWGEQGLEHSQYNAML